MKFNNVESFISKCNEIMKSGNLDIYIVDAGQFGKTIAVF